MNYTLQPRQFTSWRELKFLLGIVFALSSRLNCDFAFAAAPMINFQGFLTDAGGQPLSDVASVIFRSWTKLDAATSTIASKPVWATKK